MKKKHYVQFEIRGRYLETEFSRSWLGSPRPSFRQLQEALRRAGEDRRISLVLLCLRNHSLSWNQVQELGRAIGTIQAAGTPCWAFLEEGSLAGYLLASRCSKILAPPAVSLNLLGFRMELLYFREFLDEWGILPEFRSKGKYKSAAETFTNRRMSDPAREMLTAVLEQWRDQFVETVAEGRGLAPERIVELIDDAPFSAPRARDAGLIDQVAYDDELEEAIRQELGPVRKARAGRFTRPPGRLQRWLHPRRPQIAYLVAEGLILAGATPRKRPSIDGKLLREQLRKARENKRIGAVVLRINSPGGDATISDLVWREVARTNAVKPVIASLGDLAASGGYYLAAGARKRLVMAGTLTGSIGVIGGKFSARGLFQKLGLHSEAIEFGARSGLFSPLREQNESEQQAVERQMQETYDLFVSRVSEGIGKGREEVLEIAGGRIWTGADAVRLGLADGLGGIQEAFEAAREAAGLPADRHYRTVSFTRKKGLLASLLESES